MIELAITIWERNYQDTLSGHWFFEYQNALIGEKTILINNVVDEDHVKDLASHYQNVRTIVVKDHAEEAKKVFKLDINEKTLGYYYTIQYFVLLLIAKCPYILHVSPDCLPVFDDDFLPRSIKELEIENVLTTTIPIRDWMEAKNESYSETDNFFHARTFADHFFFAKTEELKKANYNTDYEGDFTPGYGGNSFERRLRMFMMNTGKVRAIYKTGRYLP